MTIVWLIFYINIKSGCYSISDSSVVFPFLFTITLSKYEDKDFPYTPIYIVYNSAVFLYFIMLFELILISFPCKILNNISGLIYIIDVTSLGSPLNVVIKISIYVQSLGT